MNATIEPDATLDTRLTNGRFIRAGGVTDTGFVIRNGHIHEDSDPNETAWRTVDASGFFVVPALIQPGSPLDQAAFGAAAGGVGTVITRVDAPDPDALQCELQRLSASASLDYTLIWRVPDAATAADLAQVIELGVSAFDFSNSEHAEELLHGHEELAVRVPASSLTGRRAAVSSSWRMIVKTSDPAEARYVAAGARPPVFVELQLSESVVDWPALADLSDRLFVSGDDTLLRRAFAEAVSAAGVSPVAVARLTAHTAAAAFGLERRKFGLEPGADADFVVFDPEGAPASSESYIGKVIFSMLRGEILLYNDDLHSRPGGGARLS